VCSRSCACGRDSPLSLACPCLKRDPYPKTDVLHDVPKHTGCQFCALVSFLKRYQYPQKRCPIQRPKSHRTSVWCLCFISQTRSISEELMSQITQNVSFVLLSHVLKEIHIPTTDVLDDVTNHTGHQFCALVRSLKQDPSPKTDVLYAIPII
jgi:hypothetical protein